MNVGISKTSAAVNCSVHKMDSAAVPAKKMKRSRSLDSLNSVRYENEWEKSEAGDDSGVQADTYVSLERKVDKLNEICSEQSRMLSELAEHVNRARTRAVANDEELTAALAELLGKLAEDREKNGDGGARSLLSAIEARPGLERRVGEALTELLQSEDLKQRVVSSTSASIKELIRDLFSVEVSSLYVPVMERAHRQLLEHVTKMVATAFADLEENTACNAEALRQTSQSLQAALHRHQTLLQKAFEGSNSLLDAVTSTTEKVIKRELKHWREEVTNAFPAVISECDSGRVESPSPLPDCDIPDDVVVNTNESAGLTAIDRIMLTAEVTKLIRDGAINEAFTKALLAMDLSVAVAACRAAAPALAARPALAQPVLLSLLQQLGTDLVLDTPLKCSYIEYALLNLNPSEPVSRAHLPFVAGELRRHLADFLHKYPHHTQAPRIFAIMDTARTFL